MAEPPPGTGPAPSQANPPFSAYSYPSSLGALLRRLQDQAPNSTQLIDILTFIVSGAVLLLTGLTVTGTITVLIFFGPLVVMSSPIWVPVGLVMLAAAAAAVLSTCGFGFAALAGASWMYRYLRGRHPGSADGLDHTRNRIAETASLSRVKDAAAGA